MTDDLHNEVVRAAIEEERDPALLSGRTAKLAMFVIAELFAILPMLFFIPHFDNWRGPVGYGAAILMAALGPAIALLIPRKVQDDYRAALVTSEAMRRESEANQAVLKRQLTESQAIALSIGKKQEPGA